MHRYDISNSSRAVLQRLGSFFGAGMLAGLAVMLLPCSALGQESQPGGAPEVSVDMSAVAQAAQVRSLEEEVARQRAALANLRADLERRILEEKAARDAAAAAVGGQATAAATAVMEANPRVSGSDGLTLSGFVQTDLYVKQSSENQLNGSTGAPLNDDRFTLRRLRLRASIDRRTLAATAELDANTTNGPQVRPLNVEVTAKLPSPDRVPYVAVTLGVFKIPYGYEIGQSDHERLFAERSNLERALFPGEYDLGARLSGGWKFFRYAMAVQNGEPLGTSTFPGRDPNSAKDFSGRFGMAAALGGGVDVQGGFSALVGKGFHSGTPATKPTLSWSDRNENGRLDPNEQVVYPGTSSLPSQNFSRHALGIDLVLAVTSSRLGKTTLYGEMTWASNLDRGLLVADPYGTLGRDMRERGYYVALVQDLGRYAQAGFRYDVYDPDRDSTDRQAAMTVLSSKVVQTLALAAAVRFKVGGLASRLLLQYDVNRNHFGRDISGLPTNLKSNIFTLRAEAVF